MIGMNIILDGDNCWPDIKDNYIGGDIEAAARLADAMSSGASSVAIRVKLDDGRTVIAQTSMKLFLAAAQAFKTREEMEGRPYG